jgi:hypothetical protein
MTYLHPLHRALGLALGGVILAACAGSPPPDNAEPTAPPAPTSATSPPASAAQTPTAAPATPATPTTSPTASASPAAGKPCGELDCRLFDSPEAAFAFVLAERPRVIGVGEAHAQKGMEGIDSATKRFTERFLPLLQGRTSDLIVELMLPPKGCAKAEQEVRTQQKEVTKQQASTNQNEYVVLGDAARRAGIVPDALRPTCQDLDAAAKAGDQAVPVMLETIARLSRIKTAELLARNDQSPQAKDKMVILYGGALHNDLAPKPGREAWSFGPELARATGGRYVELDVFVPESIQDTDSWRAFAWYSRYDPAAHGGSTVLFRTAPSTFALIFPRSAR